MPNVFDLGAEVRIEPGSRIPMKARFDRALMNAIAAVFDQVKHPTEVAYPVEVKLLVEIANTADMLGKSIRVTGVTEQGLNPNGAANKTRLAALGR